MNEKLRMLRFMDAKDAGNLLAIIRMRRIRRNRAFEREVEEMLSKTPIGREMGIEVQ